MSYVKTRPKDISFDVIQSREKQEISVSDRLKRPFAAIFLQRELL